MLRRRLILRLLKPELLALRQPTSRPKLGGYVASAAVAPTGGLPTAVSSGTCSRLHRRDSSFRGLCGVTPAAAQAARSPSLPYGFTFSAHAVVRPNLLSFARRVQTALGFLLAQTA